MLGVPGYNAMSAQGYKHSGTWEYRLLRCGAVCVHYKPKTDEDKRLFLCQKVIGASPLPPQEISVTWRLIPAMQSTTGAPTVEATVLPPVSSVLNLKSLCTDNWFDLPTEHLPFPRVSSVPSVPPNCSQLPSNTFPRSRYLFYLEDGGDMFLRNIGLQ
jgi:hypothetical protein